MLSGCSPLHTQIVQPHLGPASSCSQPGVARQHLKREAPSQQHRWHCAQVPCTNQRLPRGALACIATDQKTGVVQQVLDKGGPADGTASQGPGLILQSMQAPLPSYPGQSASDNTRVGAIISITVLLALATESNKAWIADHQALSMGAVFCLGYASIIVEDLLRLNKAGVALMMAAALWAVRYTQGPMVDQEVSESLSEVSQVVFFLLGAMAVVDVVDAHQGFRFISNSLRPSSLQQLLLLVAALTFCLSAVLDNLTTTIVMVSLLQKLCPDPDARRLLGAVVVVAANAGGAWTPIGDVTTTMLWIHGQLTPLPTMTSLLLPSLVSVAVPVAAWALTAPEVTRHAAGVHTPVPRLPPAQPSPQDAHTTGAAMDMQAVLCDVSEGSLAPPMRPLDSSPASHALACGTAASPPLPPLLGAVAPTPLARETLVLCAGLGTLLCVPLFRAWTGLPPYMGMMAGLGFLWLLTDAIHLGEGRRELTVPQALKRIDLEGVLFFTGILMAVGALEKAGLLREGAEALSRIVPNQDVVAVLIGLVSAVVDNVPLVAASMAMYPLELHPTDDQLWQLIAYCAGTGGSLLVIGSAAGVAYMGVEEVSFGWYLQRITPWALVGYTAGITAYFAQLQLAVPSA